jgi:hypothetical protein
MKYLKKELPAGHQWLTSVILAIRRQKSGGSQKKKKKNSLKWLIDGDTLGHLKSSRRVYGHVHWLKCKMQYFL